MIDNNKGYHTENNDKTYENHLNMDFGVQRGYDDKIIMACLKRRVVEIGFRPIGVENENFMLDYRQYEVEYFDCKTKVPTKNITPDNLLY